MASYFASVFSRAHSGFHAPQVTVEAHISHGAQGRFSIVGLPETAVKESKDRVRSAILNANFRFPDSVITVNLAPADLPKEGGRFDLAIALSILMASGQLESHQATHYEFAGELALSGHLRAIKAPLPFAIACHQAKRSLILPLENAAEASKVSQLTLYPASSLLAVCQHLSQLEQLSPHLSQNENSPSPTLDLNDVKGQFQAKRAFEIAAAGGHSLLMVGPPGVGKSMLAKRFGSLLPALTEEEALEVASLYSLVPHARQPTWLSRPFRSPHHTASYAALVGGGNPPQPGEVSLAHQGVLFLDELPQFQTRTLETLREPLENGEIHLARAGHSHCYPAKFQFISAMNPCPCGYAGDLEIACHCGPEKIQRYQQKISGPLLDRIDLRLSLPRLSQKELLQETAPKEMQSEQLKQNILHARERQYQRQSKLNAFLSPEALQLFIKDLKAPKQLETLLMHHRLSPRSYYRLLRLAKTLSDLENETLQLQHFEEALLYRQRYPALH